jgi:uncharacterized protein with PhoU and TrkA domain
VRALRVRRRRRRRAAGGGRARRRRGAPARRDPGWRLRAPTIVEDLELALGELAIEWIRVPDDSPAIGHTLADCGFRARTRITIIAILRDPEPVAGAQPGDVIQRGETLVTVGRRGQYAAFRALLAEGPFPAPAGKGPTDE